MKATIVLVPHGTTSCVMSQIHDVCCNEGNYLVISCILPTPIKQETVKWSR